MSRFELDSGPIVVGGVGGSGTRVAARMLAELGFHLGNDCNRSLDNLWFTLLLMRPRWFDAAAHEIAGEVEGALGVLGRALRGESLSAPDQALAEAAAAEASRRGYSREPPGAGAGAGDWGVAPGESWAHRRLASLKDAPRRTPGHAAGWGWKEPNSHVFLPELAHAFDDVRFVLVIRHGLDMAFSDNRNQLANWGARFGIEAPDGEPYDARHALAYWVAANERAIELGEAHLPNRFLVLNYDRMCLSPEAETRRFCEFTGAQPSREQFGRLVRIFRPPASMGRYRQHDIACFAPDQIEAVRRLGFET